jgi:hypothetical protein
MSFVRIVAEGLFRLLFWVARSAFLTQGLALFAAWMAMSMTSRQDALPAWLAIALRASLLVGGTLFVAGVLLVAARRLPIPVEGDEMRPGSLWPVLLGLSLVVLPALAYHAASELGPLWRELLTLLDRIGFWTGLERSDPYAGIIVLPILAALIVPALEVAAAFFLIAVPVAMMVLLLTRSHLFPKMFVMLSVCQAGLVLAGLFGSDAVSRLVAEAIPAMTAAPDVEVQHAAEDLRRAEGVLVQTAAALVMPTVGYLVWLPFLSLSRRVGAFFTEGAGPAPS